MASSVTVEAHRKRFTVKASPMTPLSAVVADVLGQLGLAARPEDCTLTLRGKPVADLATPLRFANVGRDKLELRTGHEPVLGVHEAPRSAAPAAAPMPPPAAVSVPAAAAAAAPAPLQSAPPAQQQQQLPQQPQAAAQPPVPPPPAAVPAPSAAAQPAAAASAAPAAAAPAAPAAAAAAPQDAHPSVALFGRRVWVFTREAEAAAEAAAAAGGQQEVDDSFYDFTEADLRRAMASAATQRAKQEGGHLMTAAMRAKEEQRRAEAFGDVPLRLYLPDGQHCLQTSLPATAPLSEVLALARAALPPAAAQAAYLFTTPPRTLLKDLSTSLYAAKLVPAAKIYVGCDAAKAGLPAAGAAQPLLRPEALALVGPPPQRADVMHSRQQQQQQQQQQQIAAGPAGGAAAARQGGAAGAAQPQKGVPKWLKLGK